MSLCLSCWTRPVGRHLCSGRARTPANAWMACGCWTCARVPGSKPPAPDPCGPIAYDNRARDLAYRAGTLEGGWVHLALTDGTRRRVLLSHVDLRSGWLDTGIGAEGTRFHASDLTAVTDAEVPVTPRRYGGSTSPSPQEETS